MRREAFGCDGSEGPVQRAAEIPPFLAMDVMADAAALERQGQDVVHMEVGEPDLPCDPHVVEAAVKALRDGEARYTVTEGILPLREAIAARYAARYGVDVDPDRILVTDSQRIEHPQKWRKCAVMTDRWRLVNGKELYDIHADPGQKKDVADEHSDVVQRLRRAYEDWWTGVSQRFEEYCEIVIGSDKEKGSHRRNRAGGDPNPARLTCHDWHGGAEPPWNQTHILKGEPSNGFWAVEVAQAGEYEFALRRWPREVDQPITAALPGGQAIQASTARLVIGEIDLTAPVGAEAKEVVFRTSLKPGKMRLQTWLTAEDGTSHGAYFVDVTRIRARV